MKYNLLHLGSLCLIATLASPSFGQTTIGNFAGGVAETGWGRFSGGVQPLDASVYTVTDLDTSGDGGALETNIAGFSDSFAYSFTTAGTVGDFFDNNFLHFDLIYRGDATVFANGGFSQVFQVLFQSDFNGFALTNYTVTADGVTLSQFGGGGTAVGWAPESEFVQTVLDVTIDYRSFKATLPDAFVPSTLQFWMSTNDDNRIYKAIDNVYLTIPEPASAMLLALGGLLAVGVARHRRS
jgi:hypothetical protein